MSQENVEIVMRGFALYNRGDREALLDLFHPNMEWRDVDHAPDVPERLFGIEGLRQLMTTWDSAFDDFGGEVEECIDAGESVLCVTRWRAEGKGSGMTTELHRAEVYAFQDNKIMRVTVYADKAEALKAVGLSE